MFPTIADPEVLEPDEETETGEEESPFTLHFFHLLMVFTMIVYHLQLGPVLSKKEIKCCAILKYVLAAVYLALLIVTAVTLEEHLVDKIWITLIVLPNILMLYSYFLFNGKCLHTKSSREIDPQRIQPEEAAI